MLFRSALASPPIFAPLRSSRAPPGCPNTTPPSAISADEDLLPPVNLDPLERSLLPRSLYFRTAQILDTFPHLFLPQVVVHVFNHRRPPPDASPTSNWWRYRGSRSPSPRQLGRLDVLHAWVTKVPSPALYFDRNAPCRSPPAMAPPCRGPSGDLAPRQRLAVSDRKSVV